MLEIQKVTYYEVQESKKSTKLELKCPGVLGNPFKQRMQYKNLKLRRSLFQTFKSTAALLTPNGPHETQRNSLPTITALKLA